MQAIILDRLRAIETEHDVVILYACESGSRAWGFESTDSDYDVRFIYLHPLQWYLLLEPQREVIETPIGDDLDIVGWDLKKTLNLFRRSNPPLYEWISSPFVYVEHTDVISRMRQLAPVFYSNRACTYHYLHMAQGNYHEFLRGGRVVRKKYLYVLRPLLAVKWLKQGLGLVPTAFRELVERLVSRGPLLDAIEDLVDQKRSGVELGEGPAIPVINDYIESELKRLASVDASVPADRPDRPLDELFLYALRAKGYL